MGDVAAPVTAGGLYQANLVLPLLVGVVTTIPLAIWVALSRNRYQSDEDLTHEA